MQCPRLDHFVRFNTNGTLTCCGHMINAQVFETIEDLHTSKWIANLKQKFAKNDWPNECVRCQQTEELGQGSIRLNALALDKEQTIDDYLLIGGTLDNTCNSACQTCSSALSTLIGKLDKTNRVFDNSEKFWKLPLERVVQLDINGGEPSVSENYKNILRNLPKNVQKLRLNTNCNVVLNDELSRLIDRGVEVTVTVSLDGIEKIHDYVRWPVKWERFYHNLIMYKSMPVSLNTWTTVSALNVGNFQEILDFVKAHDLDHSWAFLQTPNVLSVKHKNNFTDVEVPDIISNAVCIGKENEDSLLEFLAKQDKIRGINYKDFYQ